MFFSALFTPHVSLTLTGTVSIFAAVEVLCNLELWCQMFCGVEEIVYEASISNALVCCMGIVHINDNGMVFRLV